MHTLIEAFVLVGDRRLHLPRQPARHADSDHRRAGGAGRHLRRHAGAGLLGQHHLAAGAGAGDRHRRRRRDRRGRGGRAHPRARARAHARPRRPRRRWRQVTAPIIAITLVLLSVFMPTAFIPGITGQLYQQFAVAVSVSMVISAINALSLSPALCSLILRHREQAARRHGLAAERHRQEPRRLRPRW